MKAHDDVLNLPKEEQKTVMHKLSGNNKMIIVNKQIILVTGDFTKVFEMERRLP